MIHGVTADDPDFKAVRFTPGLNIVLARRLQTSSDRESRNGRGKSTLLDIIDFCLGSNPGPKSPLRRPTVAGITYSLDIDLWNIRVTVRRSPSAPSEIRVSHSGDPWPTAAGVDLLTGESVFARTEWIDKLGELLFGLVPNADFHSYRPTSRSLLSYLIRTGQGAYLDPFRQFERQSEWDIKINSLFLLGLDWRNTAGHHLLKDREAEIQSQIKAARPAEAKTTAAAISLLQNQRVQLHEQLTKSRQRLSTFRVHEEYEGLERRADEVTTKLRELNNDNLLDRTLLASIQRDRDEFSDPPQDDVDRLFEEAGLVFREQVSRRLQDARRFHSQILRNRLAFLDQEQSAARGRIESRNSEIATLDIERAELMGVLQEHGALLEFNRLQNMNLELEVQLREFDRQLESLRTGERDLGSVRLLLEQQHIDTLTDLDDRSDEIERAIGFFTRNSQYLYDAPGELRIEPGKSGVSLGVDIDRQGSHGIDHMKVFCYDLMLAQLWSTRTPRANLLIHDSIVHDGVDERQRARSLELAAVAAEEHGFQYILCLNSDTVPERDLPADFDLDQYVRLELSDESDRGGLLGRAF